MTDLVTLIAKTLNAEVFDTEVLRMYGEIWAHDEQARVLVKAQAVVVALEEAGFVVKYDALAHLAQALPTLEKH